MRHSRSRRAWPALVIALALPRLAPAGPAAPEGFEVRLVASVPAVQYPCQVATAPDGSLFVAEDPMDQVGPYEAFDGRILRFRDGRGEPEAFADGFRAIQGMAWRDGALYVCHMPFLTVVRDADGDGKADEKADLFRDLGPTDNKGLNDHIVSGIRFGMDGWLYISVGDKGVPGATRPEDGQKVQLKGGGVLRCRPDGTQLEVFTTGTRNHLEANLDAADRVFTYDNTDDGDGWWTRVTHHIDGGYYGYPHDYAGHPERFLPRMAEYGGGSPCGAVFYREDAWPEPYRGIGLWAEWGKGKVHAFRFEPEGSTFRVGEAIDFVKPDGEANFRPIDLAISADGRTLYVADWNMGGWGDKNNKVGRIWAVTYTGPADTRPRGTDADPIEAQIRQLDHPAYAERIRGQAALIRAGREALGPVTRALADPATPPLARRHLVWALDGLAGGAPEATGPLVALLGAEVADLRAQAARALGQRRVPIAVEPLMGRVSDPDPAVRLEAIIALGRIGDPRAISVLLPALKAEDTFLAFSARRALRRIGDWKASGAGLVAQDPEVRSGMILALEGVYDVEAAGLLAEAAKDAGRPAEERARELLALAQVHRKAKPWDGKWWGTRPRQGGPPTKTEDWEFTETIIDAIRTALADPEPALRSAAVRGAQETGDRTLLPALRDRFAAEADEEIRGRVALALGRLRDPEAVPLLVGALRAETSSEAIRDAALKAVEEIGGGAAQAALVERLEAGGLAGERLTRVIAAVGRSRAEPAVPALLGHLGDDAAPARAAAAEALGRIGRLEPAGDALRARLDDPDLEVRKAVIGALGRLRDREGLPALVAAAQREETRFEATTALAAMPDARAVQAFLRGLADRNPDLRRSSALALEAIRDEAAPMLERLAGRKELPPQVVPALRTIYTRPKPLRNWAVTGPFAPDAPLPLDPSEPVDLMTTYAGTGGERVGWRGFESKDRRGMVDLGSIYGTDERVAYGYAELGGPARTAELEVGSDDTLAIWVNGKQVYDFRDRRGFQPRQDRMEVELEEGVNRLIVRCGNFGGPWQFAVAVAEAPEYAFLKAPAAGAFDPEAYRRFALESRGDPARGQALFADLKGLACVKCHAVKGQGGSVGPDLSGVGATYPREELAASVLYPSAKIFSGYEPVVIATADGQVLTGILKAETAEAIEIQDAEDRRIRVGRDEIEERRTSDVSIMPSGLAEGLSREDFADLVAYLETLKEATPPKHEGGR